MDFLDDLYFNLLNWILRVSLKACAWIDDITGLTPRDDGGDGEDEH